MFTDHFFQKQVQPPNPRLDLLYTYRQTDIQTDGDYIKRVVHGPPGDHTLNKKERLFRQRGASSKCGARARARVCVWYVWRPSNTHIWSQNSCLVAAHERLIGIKMTQRRVLIKCQFKQMHTYRDKHMRIFRFQKQNGYCFAC